MILPILLLLLATTSQIASAKEYHTVLVNQSQNLSGTTVSAGCLTSPSTAGCKEALGINPLLVIACVFIISLAVAMTNERLSVLTDTVIYSIITLFLLVLFVYFLHSNVYFVNYLKQSTDPVYSIFSLSIITIIIGRIVSVFQEKNPPFKYRGWQL